MGTNFKKLFSILLVFVLSISLYFLIAPTFKAEAADLTSAYLYLSRMKIDLAGTSGEEVEMILVFRPSAAMTTGGTITITFPKGANDDQKWCRSAGALTASGVTNAPPNYSGSAFTALTGTLTATCTQATGSSGDKITISGVGALSSGTMYGVKIVTGTGRLGTGSTAGSKTVVIEAKQGTTNIQNKTIGVWLVTEDTVEVEVQVMAVPTVECTLNTSKVTLPVLYPGGVISEATVNNQISTTAPATGYYWAAYGKGNGSNAAGLYNSVAPDLIPSSATTVDLSVSNAKGFGINIGGTAGTVPSNFQTGTYGRYGGIVYGPAGARLILYKVAAATAEVASVTYGARASIDTAAGTYKEFITYVCGGYY